MHRNNLVDKLLDLRFFPGQCQWYDSADVHIWPVNVHVQFELFADGFDILEAFLEVGTCAAHPDLNFVLDKGWGELSEGANDTLKRRRNLAICSASRGFSQL